jgi:fatty acid desaturase
MENASEDGKSRFLKKSRKQHRTFRPSLSWRPSLRPRKPTTASLFDLPYPTPLPLAREQQIQRFKPRRDAFRVHGIDFLKKLGIAVPAMSICAGVIVWGPAALTVPAEIALGVLYAHDTELVHECLHNLAFRHPTLNRVAGTLLGAPMLVSCTDYKARHLPHHQKLGTENDTEFFDYDHKSINCWGALLAHAYKFKRYRQVFRKMIGAIRGQPSSGARTPVEDRQIRQEYCFLAALVVAAVAVSIILKSLVLLKLWLLPLLLAAEAAHFWIELPEHVGCDKTTRDVLHNTRTIVGSRFSRWLTNSNNLHQAHHLFEKLPIKLLPEVQKTMAPYYHNLERSYWQFYRKLVHGHYNAV